MTNKIDILNEKINMMFNLLRIKAENEETIQQNVILHCKAFFKDYEQQLQQANKRIEELEEQLKRADDDIKGECLNCANLIAREQENAELKKHYDKQLLAMINKYNALHNDIKFQKSEQKLKQIEELIDEESSFFFNEEHRRKIQQILKDGE